MGSLGPNLVVPVVMWGKHPPSHSISSILVSPDQRTVVTGSHDGQLCLWEMIPSTLKMIPKALLVGHTAPVHCLALGSNTLEANYIVSSSDDGEMYCWDLREGQCVESVKSQNVHTLIHSYPVVGSEVLRLFCIGMYPDIYVMDPLSLETVLTLSSKVYSDWFATLHVLRPARRQDDVVLGLTMGGVVKVWTLGAIDLKSHETLYEHESKQIRCVNAKTMSCCLYNQRTVIIVNPQTWQIYDAGDFSLLCSVHSSVGECWIGGEFLSTDRVMVWTQLGRSFIYRLPTNCIVESKDFHNKAMQGDDPFLYCILGVHDPKAFPVAPAFRFQLTVRDGQLLKFMFRGDHSGLVNAWPIPEVSDNQIAQIQQIEMHKTPEMASLAISSLGEHWGNPTGVLSHLSEEFHTNDITSSVYIPLQGKLVCGLRNGNIVAVPAVKTLIKLLLETEEEGYPSHQVLKGHRGRVTCLLYPHQTHSRYDMNHLVSGGTDFSVCLWDLSNGTLLHRFCVQAGEVVQLLVTPPNCSTRVQNCVCSIAKDHSVALLSLKERKCVLLASRHLFPVTTIKWRPLDDFMMVGCADGTLYVWQMETGHLDRVVHGMTAEEILHACDEHSVLVDLADGGLANPAIHFLRGLRHRNIAAIKHAAQRGLNKLHELQHGSHQESADAGKRGVPLNIQGLKTHPRDSEAHVLFFDTEGLVVQLLSEEYSMMSPNTLEAQGLINQSEYQKVLTLTQTASPDAQKKIAEFFGKVKDKAEDMERKLKDKDKHGLLAKVKEGAESMQIRMQPKNESVGFRANTASPDSAAVAAKEDGSQHSTPSHQRRFPAPHALPMSWNLTTEIGQLMLSLLHAWGLDSELDHCCQARLGLLKPKKAISYGIVSRTGQMVLLLPTWRPNMQLTQQQTVEDFTSKGHWEISSILTTNHLLSVVSLANTLMAMQNASFTHNRPPRTSLDDEKDASQIKQSWSLMAALHCILLPEKVLQKEQESMDFHYAKHSHLHKEELQLEQQMAHLRACQVEALARRWQDRCLEIREAAQAVLLAELERIGPEGRKKLVDTWSPFLPSYADPFSSTTSLNPPPSIANNLTQHANHAEGATPSPKTNEQHEEEEEDDDEEEEGKRSSRIADTKRKQTTAVILLGVIGAEFGQDIEANKCQNVATEQRKRNTVEGFGLGNNSLARLTSKALSYLLLSPPSPKFPLHTPFRRAAIDLIGRGFTVWEPYLDVSKVLLGLLELCCEADKLIPSMSYGLPLSPIADSCRTARHSLTLIATARPGAFITTMAREIARYNTVQQNAQTLNVNLSNSILSRAKPEILREVELLIDKMQSEIADLLVEVVDMVLHCLDHGHLKSKSLCQVFPAVCRFSQVSHCPATRRVAVGNRNGAIVLYELRGGKNQTIAAHTAEVTACSFSPDGKNLASYCSTENKLSFWQQTTTGVFGLGAVQTRCVKSFSTTPIPDALKVNPLKMARLNWLSGKVVALMLVDGSETRYNL